MAEHLGHERRPDDRAQTVEAGDRALQLALGVGGDLLRGERVDRWIGEREQKGGERHDVHHPAFGREGVSDVGDERGGHAGGGGPPLAADPRDEHPREHALGNGHDEADEGERITDLGAGPVKLGYGVERPGAGQDLVSELPQEQRTEQPAHRRELEDLQQRAERIGARPVKRAARLPRQRLRQREVAERGVGERDGAGGEERRPRPQAPEQAADGRTDDEADTERRPHETEILRAPRRRGDVRDVGVRRREGCARHARHHAPDEQPRDHGRKSHDQVVATEREQREQQHRPAPEAIAQVAEHRGAEELQQRVHERQPAAVNGGPVHAHSGELHDEPRQDRQDDAKADRVDQHGDEDEREGATAGFAQAHEGLSARTRYLIRSATRPSCGTTVPQRRWCTARSRAVSPGPVPWRPPMRP